MKISYLSIKLENSFSGSIKKRNVINENNSVLSSNRSSLYSKSYRNNKENIEFDNNISFNNSFHSKNERKIYNLNNENGPKIRYNFTPRNILRKRNFREKVENSVLFSIQSCRSSSIRSTVSSKNSIYSLENKNNNFAKTARSSKINCKNKKKDRKKSGIMNYQENLLNSNILNKQYYNDHWTRRDGQNSIKNPLIGRKYSFNRKKDKNEKITITNVNSVKYAHMNKSEFKKQHRKTLKLNNFNRKFQMGNQDPLRHKRLTSNITSTKDQRSTGVKSRSRSYRNERNGPYIDNIIDKINYDKIEDNTRRNLFRDERDSGEQKEKKAPFIAKRVNLDILENPQITIPNEENYFQNNNQLEIDVTNDNYASNTVDSRRNGWQSAKASRTFSQGFNVFNSKRVSYCEKENKNNMKKFNFNYEFTRDTSQNKNYNLLNNNNQNEFEENLIENANIKEYEIDVKNPLLTNYGAYYKEPLEVKKDKSMSRITERKSGILKNKVPSSMKKSRSKSVKFREEANVNDNTIVKLKIEGEFNKPKK